MEKLEQRAAGIRRQSLALGSCVIHHEPLKQRTVYGYSHSAIIHFGETVERCYAKYPNAIGLFQGLSKGEWFAREEETFHCRLCDEAVRQCLE